MNWIYDNYDFENRLNNLMWTISGDYSANAKEKEYNYELKDYAIYEAAMMGGRQKYIDWELMKKYLNYRIIEGIDKEIILPIIEMCSDSMIEEKLIKDRPGIANIRDEGLALLLQNYFRVKAVTFTDKIKYAYVLQKNNKYGAVDKEIKDILHDINDSKNCNDTVELINNIDKIYNEHFFGKVENTQYLNDNKTELENKKFKELNGNYYENFSDFMYEELYEENIEISEEIEKIASSSLVESIGEIKSDKISKENRVIYVDEEVANQIYSRIEHYYGKSFLTNQEIKNIEKKVCRNAHEGCRVHFTDGVLRADCDNVFQKKYVTRQKERNVSAYKDNIKIHKRNIIKLKDALLRTLIMKEEKSNIPSDRGSLVVNKVWRVSRSNNTRIFTKNDNKNVGGFVVDILLDASGSQSKNQTRVANQGYIISQALTLANIPNRVTSFCSFLDYTILRRFRDYNSSIDESENIFEYFSAGNNRDGLAINAVCENLIIKEEENKILIVLSDGKPNDIKIGNRESRTLRGELSYKGSIAIKDTALQVRKARKSGILVLGVFTGKEEDLVAEKLIYGKDFIYTKNIDKFADIVGTYLKRIIENGQ